MRYFRILHVINDIQERALNNYPQLTICLKFAFSGFWEAQQ